MRRAYVMILQAAACGIAAFGQAPVVHARLEPASEIIVGQPVRLVVEVLVPNYFTGSPDFPEFEMESAIVVLPQERAQNTNAHINGMTYAGIIETYTIYPQQPGEFQLPPAEISVTYAAVPPKSTTARVSIPPLKFRADLPAAAQGLDYFLPTTRLTIQQKWSQPLSNVQAGNSLTRTITVTATKMQAMLIPPLPALAPDGIRVYQDEPVVQDQKTSRGDFVFGRRIQTAKYLIQKEGDYTLPPIELKWWNLSTKKIESAVLPPVHFLASANPGVVSELPPETEPAAVAQPEPVPFWKRYKSWIETGLSVAACGLLVLWLAVRYVPKVYSSYRAWRRQVLHSEPTAFGKLMNACRKNDASESYSCLLRWLSLWQPEKGLQDLLSESRDAELSAQVEHLCKALYSSEQQRSNWNGAALAAALKSVRGKKSASNASPSTLPLINPVR